MSRPLLTIGIPTLDRPEFLHRALASCLAQTVPVNIIVADQGHLEDTEMVVADAHHSGPRCDWYKPELIYYFWTNASNLWENWEAAARECDTPYFAWLQDDDLIRPGYAARIIAGFDAFPEAGVWMGCNKLAVSESLGYWGNGNGPWVPLNFATGHPDQWEGQILVPTAYFTSWSLSPSVAFRCGERFNRALEAMPEGFDLFQERAIIAAAAYDSRFIADPMISGLWIHHGGNESYKQHHDQPRQTKILVDWLDDLMDRTEGWESILDAWCQLMHPTWLVNWLNQLGVTQTEGHPGRYTEKIKRVMLNSMRGRVEVKAMTVDEVEQNTAPWVKV